MTSRLREASLKNFKEDRKREQKKVILVAGVVGLLILITVVLGAGVFIAYSVAVDANAEEPVIEHDFIPIPATSTTTSTSTTSTTTTSITSTTTTTSSTTTTTLCGGDLLKPCEVGGCDPGFVLDSQGLCQDPECVPSIESGRDGCGSFALRYCQRG